MFPRCFLSFVEVLKFSHPTVDGQELILKAVRDTGSALQYASQRLQNDPEAWETQRFLEKNERENDRCLIGNGLGACL